MDCEDRERLTAICLAAISERETASLNIIDRKSASGEQTKGKDKDVLDALAALDRHRATHGC